MKNEESKLEAQREQLDIPVVSGSASNIIECPKCYGSGFQIVFTEYYYNGTWKEYKCQVCETRFMRPA